VVALGLTGCPDQQISYVNSDPTAEITSHADGEQLEAGLHRFMGTVDDVDHVNEDLAASWSYEGEEVCPALPPDSNGSISCEIFLESGARKVVLEVRDAGDGIASALVNLDVQPYGEPWAEITAPEQGGIY